MPEQIPQRSSPPNSLADEFAALWESGDGSPDVFAFLKGHPQAAVSERAQVLRVDQSHGWSSGSGRPVEEYLARCPDVAADERLKLELIAAEFEQRTQQGEALDVDDYLERFPDVKASLRDTLSPRSDSTVNGARAAVSETIDVPGPGISETIDVPPPKPVPSSGGETMQVDVSFGKKSPARAESPQNAPDTRRVRDTTKADVIGRFGDYELLQEIARGGMGVVYKARQVKLNRVVALKMILTGQLADDEEIARFHTEAEAAARLDHPNIVPIYEVGEHEGRHYFSMGFVEGKSLAEKVAEGPLPPREAADVMETVAEAVAYAHERKIIHRDLKPANVLMDATGQPRVTDFGLAKSTETASQLTATGQVMGTPSYMPPEQALGKLDEVGPLSDVYSLGALLYCLLTGRPPFQAANVVDTLRQVVEKEPVPPQQLNPEVDRDLETICLKCLSKEPHGRYASAAELAEELGRFLAGEPIHARPVGAAERLWRWCKRKPVVASLIALSVLLLLTGTVVSTSFAIVAHRRALEAERERENATRAVNDFFTRVSEETLLNQPGLQPLRRELLQRALSYYQEFLRTRRHDPTILDELAETFYRVGVITGEIESPSKALPYYDQGLTLARKYVAENPANRDALRTLGDLLNAKGKALVRTQRLDEAFGVYREAIDVRDRLVKRAPDRTEFQRLLANSHMNLGLVEKERGNADAARKLMEQAQEIRRRQLVRADDPKLRRDLAMGAYNLGNLLYNDQDIRVPEKYLAEAAENFEKVVAHDTRDLNNQYFLAICYRLLGELKWFEEDWDAVAVDYRKAHGRLETLAQQNPDVPEYQAALANVYLSLGELDHRQRRAAESLKAFQQALDVSERLYRQHSDVSQYRRDFAVALRAVGQAEWDTGERDRSLKNVKSARDHFRDLVEQYPDNEEYRHQLQLTESTLHTMEAPQSDRAAAP